MGSISGLRKEAGGVAGAAGEGYQSDGCCRAMSHVGWSHVLALSQMLCFIIISPPPKKINYEYLRSPPFLFYTHLFIKVYSDT